MILLPAIDLMGGEVVRLRQGKAQEKTVYSNDPAAFARRWQEEGGDYLHIVDLDAAFTGEQRNLDSVREIVKAMNGVMAMAAQERQNKYEGFPAIEQLSKLGHNPTELMRRMGAIR